MQATAGGLTTGTLGAFTVTAGAAADITLTGSTANLASGTTRVLTATITDAAGNTVTTDNSTVVTFAQLGGLGTVTGTGNATARAASPPRPSPARSPAPSTSRPTSAGLSTGSLSFVVTHGTASDVVLTGSTAALASGDARVLTATLVDAAGNTVTSRQLDRGHASPRPPAPARSPAPAPRPPRTGSPPRPSPAPLAGTVAMEATASGLTTGTLGAFTVTAGAATQIELTGSTANLTSGATRVLTATLKDAAGNVATSDSTTVVAFGQAGGLGSVTGLGNSTASAGVATKTVTGALAGTVNLEATASGLATGSLSFVVVHGAATQIALSGSTSSLASGSARP